MRLTIFGATGRTGTVLVGQALDDGHHITVVARDPSRVAVHHPALTVAGIPDLADPRTVRSALYRADAVLSAIGPRRRRDAPVAAPATRAILQALDAADSARVVVTSAAPVGPGPQDDSPLNRRILVPVIGAAFRPVYADLAEMEAALAASNAAWTAFRPAKLTNGPLTRTYRTALGNAVPAGYTISRADLAHAMLASLTQAETERAVVGIAY